MDFKYNTVAEVAQMLIKKEITQKDLYSKIKQNEFQEKILFFLKEAHVKKDENTLESLIYIIFCFNLKSLSFLNVFNELLIETWHFKHEDLVTLIDSYCSEGSVLYLKKAATMRLNYLYYAEDETFALASKCIWALGNIGTHQAADALKVLQNNFNSIISAKATEQLKRLNIL